MVVVFVFVYLIGQEKEKKETHVKLYFVGIIGQVRTAGNILCGISV